MIMTMLVAMISTPFILKFLNKEEYGLSTILFQIVSYLSLLDFGLGNAVSRFLATTRGNDEASRMSMNKIVSTSFYIYSVLGGFVILVGLSLASYLPRIFDMDPSLNEVAVSIAYTLSIFVGLQFPLRVFSSIFFAHQKLVLSNTMSFIVGLLNQILPVVFLYFGFGLWSFVYTNIIGTLISISVTLFLIRRFYPYLRIRLGYFDKTLLKQMFSFGFYIFLNVLAVYVIFLTDRFFIGTLVSLSVVSMYLITAKIPEICRDLIFRITDNSYPAVVEIASKENTERFARVHHKLMRITTSLAMVAFWMILILDKWFVELWVGSSFFAGTGVLVLVLVLMVIQAVLHVSAICLNGAGIVKGFTIASIFEAGFKIVLTLFLGKLYGIKGILLSTIIASSLTSLWYIPFQAMKYMNISLKEYAAKTIFFPVLSVGSFGALLFWGSTYLTQFMAPTWINLIGVGFTLSMLFLAFTWFILLKGEVIDMLPQKIRAKLNYL
jgi:O-antigen/teichoic acid export membrane protein